MTLGEFFLISTLVGHRDSYSYSYYESYEEKKDELRQTKIRDKLIAEEMQIVSAINKINPIIDENKELLSDVFLELIEKDDQEFTKNIQEATDSYNETWALWADDKESYDSVITAMERVVSIKRDYCEGILKTFEHISVLSGKSIDEFLKEKTHQSPQKNLPKTQKLTQTKTNSSSQKESLTLLSIFSNIFFLPFRKIFYLSIPKAVLSVFLMFCSWVLIIYISSKIFGSSKNIPPFLNLGLLLISSHIAMAFFKKPPYEKSLIHLILSLKFVKYLIRPLWRIFFKIFLLPFEKIFAQNILRGIFSLCLMLFCWFVAVVIFGLIYAAITDVNDFFSDQRFSICAWGLFFLIAHITASRVSKHSQAIS